MLACPPYSGEGEETCDTPQANDTTNWYRIPAHTVQLMRLDVNVLNSRILTRSEPVKLKGNLCLFDSPTCPEKEPFEDVCNESFPFPVDFPERNRNSNELYGESLDCPWTYHCEYDAKRIPAIMLHTTCEQPPESAGYGCQEIRYMIPVLKTEECPLTGNDTWNLDLELVTVGCARYSL